MEIASDLESPLHLIVISIIQTKRHVITALCKEIFRVIFANKFQPAFTGRTWYDLLELQFFQFAFCFLMDGHTIRFRTGKISIGRESDFARIAIKVIQVG